MEPRTKPRNDRTFDAMLKEAFLAGAIFAEGPDRELSIDEGFDKWKARLLP